MASKLLISNPVAPPAWTQVPKPIPLPNDPVIECWCGGGGVGLAGFVQEGFKVGANIDRDPERPRLSDVIADFYELNYKSKVIRETLQDHAQRGGFRERLPDVVFLTQSCKNLSLANHTGREDNTDLVVARAAARGIGEQLPKVFVIENVPKYKNSQCLDILIKTFKRLNYKVKYGVIDASWYEVSQRRKRFILIATRHDIPMPILNLVPPPTYKNSPGWLSVVQDLKFELSEPTRYQELVVSNLKPGLYTVERAGARFKKPHCRSINQPMWALRSAAWIDQKGYSRWDGLNVWDGKDWYRASARAVARWMGLYDWYQLPEQPAVFGTLLCNGVPPLMTAAIARAIKSVLH